MSEHRRVGEGVDLPPDHRPATRGDAAALAQLVNLAGEGLPYYLWSGMAAGGESAWEVGAERARRESGGFSYRNAIVREQDGEVVACLIGYPLPDPPPPADYSGMPAMFVPLQQLEDLAPGTWYVNVLAVLPGHRGRGYGGVLLDLAREAGLAAGSAGLSLIVADTNSGARRLYERNGYRERARRAMVKEAWQNPGREWVLLVREA